MRQEWVCTVCGYAVQKPETLRETLSPGFRQGRCLRCAKQRTFKQVENTPPAPTVNVTRSAVTQTAMSAATAATSEEFRREFLKAVHWVAERHPDFTTDEVWARLSDRGVAVPAETRGVGSLMRSAAKYGWIAKTDRKRPSTRATTSKGGVHHTTDVNVWRSNLHIAQVSA